MKFLVLKTKNPYINLAIEEYLFSKTKDDIFMLWQNEPSVIIGKNQNAFTEINMNYVKEHNIHIVRRITGGGAVYHDLGNVNYSFISNRDKSTGIDFEYFTEPIIKSLKNIGIEAKLSGRNDLIVDERKISGNAQHTDGTRVLHHGTLLFDSNLDVLSLALKVDDEKLRAKAIKSTHSRVINLKPLIKESINVEAFINILSDYIINTFSPEFIDAPVSSEIDELAVRNSSFEWIYPKRAFLSDYTIIKKKKYPFGLVEVHMNMSNDIISDIKFFGDFFGNRDIFEIEKLLLGESIFKIKNLLKNISISDYIFGMTNDILEEHLKG